MNDPFKDLPSSFQLKVIEKCKCNKCNCETQKFITYELKIDVLDSFLEGGKFRRRYRIYYSSRKYGYTQIGENVGIGYDLHKEIENIKKLLNILRK